MANNFLYAAAAEETLPVHLVLAGQTDPESTGLIIRHRTTPLFVIQSLDSGRGVLEIGGQRIEVPSNSILITPPWSEYRYYPDARDPWSKTWFNITGRLFPEVLQSLGLDGKYLFTDCRECREMLRQAVFAVPRLPAASVDDFVAGRLFQLLLTLSKHQRQSGGAASVAERLKAYLDEHVLGPAPALGDMSAYLKLSVAQLTRLFRNAYHVTPYAFLLQEKLHTAAEILRNSPCTIREAARRLGFANEFYFTRIFKQKLGCTPGKYRCQPGSSAPAGNG